jgi:uncharacterized protein
MANAQRPISILSIDGGGTRGIIPALVLHELDRLITQRISNAADGGHFVDFFDVVAGTSTGAIIAAGLAGISDEQHVSGLAELIEFYRHEAVDVFSRPSWLPESVGRKLSGIFSPKFKAGQQRLKQKFGEICRDARLSNAAANVVIPAFTGKGAFVFRGGPDWPVGTVSDYFLRDVLLATTAAPYVFPPSRIMAIGHAEIESFIDGGVFANNPALHAYLDARQLFGSYRDILLVSLGTASDFIPLDYHAVFRWGGLGWLNVRKGLPLIQAFMLGQSKDTHSILQQLIPDPRSYIRLDIQTRTPLPEFFDASSAAMQTFEDLAGRIIEQNTELLEDLANTLAKLGRVRRSRSSSG